jgi:hypothetical protein
LQQFIADATRLKNLIHYAGRAPRCQVDGSHTEYNGLTHYSAALGLTFTGFADDESAVLDGDKSNLFHLSIII